MGNERSGGAGTVHRFAIREKSDIGGFEIGSRGAPTGNFPPIPSLCVRSHRRRIQFGRIGRKNTYHKTNPNRCAAVASANGIDKKSGKIRQ